MTSTILWFITAAFATILIAKVIYALSIVVALPQTGGALFCFTHHSKIEAILDAIPFKKDQILYDLGCGDGRFMSAAEKRYGTRGVGFEINLLASLMARFRRFFSGRYFEVKRESFWEADLGDADVVFCYLFPDLMERLAPKAAREMKAGALFISCNFPLPGWSPERIIQSSNRSQIDPIYIYKKAECPSQVSKV